MTASTKNRALANSYVAPAAIGAKMVMCSPIHANTVVKVQRINTNIYEATCEKAADAFRGRKNASAYKVATVTHIGSRYVVEYLDEGVMVEIAECRALEVALGVAVDHVSEQGHLSKFW